MLRKIRRRYERLFASKRPAGSSGRAKLQLENLERRVLLDTAGMWDILGYRGAEGGGVSIDPTTDAAEAELVLSVDGDPVIFWVEGTLEEYVGATGDGSGRVMFHWQMSGPIYARQYSGEDIGWWDLRSGSGDPGGEIGTGSELDAAAGPNGEIALTWVNGGSISVSLWDGNEWTDLGSASDGPTSEKPSIAISNMGEIFVSYTAIHPNSSEGQRDIVVKKYGDLGWTELISDDVGLFGGNLDGSPQKTGGVSNDDGDSFDSSIAIDLAGRPIVAWMSSPWQGGGDICVKRWNGQSWGEWPEGSASDPDNDGNFGISNDSTMSLQPDIAISDDGDVIVTWVNWQNWENYDTNGQAGVFVKVLHPGSVWESYAAGSASGAGIAQDSGLAAGMADLGWYYSPKIDLDSSGQPFIVWQGFGEGERNTANRTDPTDGDESPLMSVYASHYDSGSFDLLYSNNRGVANKGGLIAWMPTGLVGANDELVMAYTWHDSESDNSHHDDEIFVQYWDTNAWKDFGRGAGSNGNELVGNFPTWLSAGDEIQMGVIDYDGDPSTEMDVMASVPDTSGGNNSKLYLYRRDIDEWTNDTSVSDISFGWVHDLRGDPNPESNVNGAPLLAYLDDLTRLPYVYKWTQAGWNLVGGVAAGSAGTLNNEGISVQAGPNETIMLAYTKDVLSHGVTTGQIVTRLWDPAVGSWADADLGTLPVEGGKEAAYFANFDGFDWDGTSWNNNWDDHNGDVNEGQYDDDGNRIYDEQWGWYFWDLWNPLNDGEISELVTGGTSDEAGRLWVNSDGDDQTGGVEIVITVPEDDPVSGLAGTSIVGNLDHFFRLINDGYINVELSYSLDAQGIPGDDSNPGSENIDLEIRLVVDGVDCGQIATVSAGEMIGYSDATEWHFDSKTFAGGPLDLSAGWHTVGIYAVATVQEIQDLSFTFDDGGINGTEFAAWVPEPDPPEANAVYTCADIDVPVLGGVDGNEGILLTLGPAGATQAATYTFTRAGDITVDFYYELDTAALEAGDTLALFVELDGNQDDVDRTDLEIISTGGPSNLQGYYHHTFTEMAPGEHTLTLRGELVDANDNETGTIGLDSITISATEMGVEQVVRARMDNFAVYQRATPAAGTLSDSDTYDFETGLEGWVYADVSDVAGVVDGDVSVGTGVGGSDGLEMTLGDGLAGEEDMSGRFLQTLNLADSQYTTITFSYNLEVDQNVAEGETLSLYVMLGGTELGTFQVTGTGAGTVTSGWQEITINAGVLQGGAYTLSFVATLTNSDVNVEAQGWFYLDDVEIDYYSTYSRWEFPSTPNGDVGGNTAVGPGDNGTFNFQGNIHSILTDTGALQSQEYRIEDIVQAADGSMEISFRYRLTGSWDADIQVFVDAVECDSEDPIDHPLPLLWADSSAWYNGDDTDQEYTWVRAEAEDIAAGSHTVRIVVSGTGETELWIDNLTILASEPTDLERPMATLLGAGSGGTRAFSVTAINRSEGLRVYANAEQDSDGVSEVWPDSTILGYYGDPAFLDDGYTTCTVYELNNNEWTKYGLDVEVTQGIDFLGVVSNEGAAMVQMPGSTVMIVADIAIGPGGLPWLAAYRAQTDWVDISDPADGVQDYFVIHWETINSQAYWTVPYTVLDSQILAWMNAPADPRGNANFVPHWEDMGFAPTEVYHAYTELELVSSGGKRPAVAWTQRNEYGSIWDAGAMRWEDGVWGVLGDVESVQNGDYWSALFMMEMIVMPGSDSNPIVAYYMGHLDCYGIREFLAGTDIPQMVVSEESGTPDDDLLEFDTTTISYVDQSFSVTNTGQVDLTIYGIEMGGYGDLDSNPFSLWPSGLEFPISLASGESKGFVVRFDPTGVPAGYYDSVLVVHTNMPTHPTHPFAHFYELSMHVEVDSQTGMDVNDLSFVYDDTIINGGWIPDLSGKFQQEFTVATPGNVNLGFDYQLLLGERLTGGETLDLLVSVDGVDVTSLGDYRIEGGKSQDSGYLSVVLTLNNLTAGGHVLAIQGELSRSTGGVIGGTGTMRLDNITLAGASWNFNLYPGVGVWEFTGDTEDPDATDGSWDRNSGVSGSGGLEAVLGDPLEIKELIITNTGESDLTISEWGFGGTAFRILNVAQDGVAGAVISRYQVDGSYDEENISSENMVGASDDVVLQPDDFLTLMIVFEPTEIRENGFSDILRITSNDINNEYVAVTLSGIGVSGARIGVEVDGESVADYDPVTLEYDQIDFGSVIKGQSGQVEVTIRNNGSSDLTLLSVVENNVPPELVIWPVLDNYVLTPKGTPGDEVVVTLTYTPSISEEENDQSPVALETMLAITSDDPDLADRLFTIEVVGLAVPQIPLVELIDMDTDEPMNPDAPYRLDFGNVYIGSPMVKTFQVNNIGGAQLRLERFQIEHITTVAGTNLFVVEPQNPPGDSGDIILAYGSDPYTITVTFTPAAAGVGWDKLHIWYYDEIEGEEVLAKTTLNLIGTGIGQKLDVTDSQGNPGDGQIDFESVGQGRTAIQTITLTNTGSSNLTITGWTLTGDTDEFSLVGASGQVILGPGKTRGIGVEFTPSSATGSFSGTVTIVSNDPESPVTVTLTGAGATPGQVAIDTESLNFGSLVVGSSATESFTIRNDGSSDLLVTGIEVDSLYFTLDTLLDPDDDSDDFPLVPGQERVVSVTFRPVNMFDTRTMDQPPAVVVTTDDQSGGGPVETTVALRGQSILTSQVSGGKLLWTDSNNNIIQIVVSGGTASIVPVDGNNRDIGKIELSGTNTKSVLTVTGPKSGARIGQITGEILKNIVLKNITLDGDMNDDGLEDNDNAIEVDVLTGMLQLGDIVNGADITIHNTLGKGAKISAGVIGDDTDIVVGQGNAQGKVAKFQATSFGLGTLTADSLAGLKVGNGDFDAIVQIDGDAGTISLTGTNVAGSFIIGGDLTNLKAANAGFSGTVAAENIGTISFGNMIGAEICVRGELGKLTSRGNMIDSLILAGYNLGADGQIGTSDDSPASGGRINNVKISGGVGSSYILSGIVPNTPGNFNVFGNPPLTQNMLTGTIGQIRFGDVFDSGPAFGVAAHGNIAKVQVGSIALTPGASPWDYFQMQEF